MVVDILTLLIMYYSIQETWNSVCAKNVQFDGWTGLEVFPLHLLTNYIWDYTDHQPALGWLSDSTLQRIVDAGIWHL